MVTRLILALGFLSFCIAREYNCTTDQNSCPGSNAQEIIISGVRMCCPHGAHFRVDNDLCSCVDNTDLTEEECLTGGEQCGQAALTSRDSAGKVRCCRAGFTLNSVTHSYVNGVLMDLCTCTPPGARNFLSMFPGQANAGGSSVTRDHSSSRWPGSLYRSLHITSSHSGRSGMLVSAVSRLSTISHKVQSWIHGLHQFLANRTRFPPFAAFRSRTSSRSKGRSGRQGRPVTVPKKFRPFFFRSRQRPVTSRPWAPTTTPRNAPFPAEPMAPPESATRPPSGGRVPIEP